MREWTTDRGRRIVAPDIHEARAIAKAYDMGKVTGKGQRIGLEHAATTYNSKPRGRRKKWTNM